MQWLKKVGSIMMVAVLIAIMMLLQGCGESSKGPSSTPAPHESEQVVMLEWAVPTNASSSQRYRDLTRALVQPTNQEPGCLHFDIYEDVVLGTNVSRIWQYLVFVDEQAHQAHMSSTHVKSWLAEISGLLKDEKLTPLTMAVPADHPVTCLKQQAPSMVVVLVQMYTEDKAQRALLQQASVDLIEGTRQEDGCLYYDQLIPAGASSTDAVYVQEVLWFVDEVAHQKHMNSKVVQRFVDATAAAKPVFNVTFVNSHTSLPPCAMTFV